MKKVLFVVMGMIFACHVSATLDDTKVNSSAAVEDGMSEDVQVACQELSKVFSKRPLVAIALKNMRALTHNGLPLKVAGNQVYFLECAEAAVAELAELGILNKVPIEKTFFFWSSQVGFGYTFPDYVLEAIPIALEGCLRSKL